MEERQKLSEGLVDALRMVVQASSQNSSKGNAVRNWFKTNFDVEGRVSLVNEKKQAYNRPKEQLSKRDVDDIIFIVVDTDTVGALVRKAIDISYPALKTILVVLYDKGTEKFSPLVLYKNGESSVANFIEEMNPSLEVRDFSPPKENSAISDGSPSYSDLVTFDEEGPVEEPKISEDDAVLQQVEALLKDGYAGVIFTGAPGTSKSWYARQIGLRLTKGRMNDLYFVQFHPGYQYEDFIESYIPTEDGGFVLSKKTFLRACDTATSKPDANVVVVIDELTRTDVVRVFGEALTYLETSKRDFEFQLASGRFFRIPKNLIVICTMNPWDRGVDELDLAFERRFAKIAFNPDVELLREMMKGSPLDARMKASLEQFFFIVSRHQNPLCHIGHAYFQRVTDIGSLHRLWDNQLRFHFERILRNEPDEYKKIQEAWSRIFDSPSE